MGAIVESGLIVCCYRGRYALQVDMLVFFIGADARLPDPCVVLAGV